MSERPFRRLAPYRLRPDQVEPVIADLPFERAYLFDSSERQVARFEGDESRVLIELSELERRRVRDGLLIHNHAPDLEPPSGDPRYDSVSLSELDIRWAREHDLATIVAVSPTWRHVLHRPPNGWLGVLPNSAEFEDSLSLLYDDLEALDTDRVRWREISFEEAMATRAHRANERFCREIGAIYRRERRLAFGFSTIERETMT
jgi:hypothetical protein